MRMAVDTLRSERHAVTMYVQEGRCYFGNGTVQLVSSCLSTLVMKLGINVLLLPDSSHSRDAPVFLGVTSVTWFAINRHVFSNYLVKW
jgi:hypothetical protein